MPQVAVNVNAEDLYEKEIQRLQGEVGQLSNEKSKLQIQNDSLRSENNKLESGLQKLRDATAAQEETHKKLGDSFNKSRANAVSAMDKREKESEIKIDLAEKKTAELLQLGNRISSAKGQLLAIAEDGIATLDKTEKSIASLLGSIRKELGTYLVLRDPKAEVPAAKKG